MREKETERERERETLPVILLSSEQDPSWSEQVKTDDENQLSYTIDNALPRTDTAGEIVNAHQGHITRFPDGRYYWVGSAWIPCALKRCASLTPPPSPLILSYKCTKSLCGAGESTAAMSAPHETWSAPPFNVPRHTHAHTHTHTHSENLPSRLLNVESEGTCFV